jgi:hypothetical protein
MICSRDLTVDALKKASSVRITISLKYFNMRIFQMALRSSNICMDFFANPPCTPRALGGAA